MIAPSTLRARDLPSTPLKLNLACIGAAFCLDVFALFTSDATLTGRWVLFLGRVCGHEVGRPAVRQRLSANGTNSAQWRGIGDLRSGKRHNQSGRAMDGLEWRTRLRGKLLYTSLHLPLPPPASPNVNLPAGQPLLSPASRRSHSLILCRLDVPENPSLSHVSTACALSVRSPNRPTNLITQHRVPPAFYGHHPLSPYTLRIRCTPNWPLRMLQNATAISSRGQASMTMAQCGLQHPDIY